MFNADLIDIRNNILLFTLGFIGYHVYAYIVNKIKQKRNKEEQNEVLRIALINDQRWMSHNPFIRTLTQRYLDILSPDWKTKVIKDSATVRVELKIEPNYSSASWLIISPDGIISTGTAATPLAMDAYRDYSARRKESTGS